jgi:L-alanine-DL-glutamate epimerase-like enolase superfamily enzyme
MAVAHNKPVMPHSPTAGINSIASIHCYSTVKNAVRPHEFSTEFSGPLEPIQELFNEPMLPVKGIQKMPDGPGWGLTINEKALEKAMAD